MSRVLIIDSDLTGGDFAWKCAEWGHEVKLYQSPNKDRSPVWDMFGFPGIERVNNWEKEMPWAMKGNGIVVNLFNDKVITAKLDKWQAFGAKVFGPTMKSAKLEHDRGAGMKFMQEHGIEVPKYHTFNTLEEVEKFAWKAERPYVFKTAGDLEDKSLTYCAHDPADLVSWLETKKRHGLKLKGPLMLQEKINMIAEIGISAWMGKDGFLPHYNLNFEFKKNLAGDFGKAVGEEGTVTRYYDENSLATEMLLPFEEELLKLGHRGDFDVGMGVDDKGRLWPFEFSCFDEETEVLTDRGWKKFSQVRLGEKMATLNPDTEELEYLPNVGVLKKSYIGPMIHFSGTSSAPEFMVTPDHQMWVGKVKTRKKVVGKYEFVDAEKCGSGMQIKRGISSWLGDDAESFTLPSYTEKHFLGRSKTYIDIEHPKVVMSMKSWMGFLGLMLSEGCVRSHHVTITQMEHRKHKIRDFLEGFGLPVIESGKEFRIHSVQLAEYMRSLGWGKQPVRRIPRKFMGMSARHLNVMLDALIAGDGSVHKRNGQRTYYSTSSGLADDVQELMLKCGYPSRIVRNAVAGSVMSVGNGSDYIRNHDIYVVSERRERTTGWLDNRYKKTIQYSGNVYCCDVPPHHLLYVRRNGNAAWCGNCRFGWPSTQILMACHDCDPVQWMITALSTGEDDLITDNRTAVGVLLTRPPYPSKNDDLQSSVGYVVTGLEEIWEHVSPWNLMIEEGPIMKDGKVDKGPCYKTTGDYIAVITAKGADVHDCLDEVYAAVAKVKTADIQCRIDVGKRLEKELPKLKAFGIECPDW